MAEVCWGRQKTNIVVIWPYDALIGINNHNVIGLAGLVTKHLPPPFLQIVMRIKVIHYSYSTQTVEYNIHVLFNQISNFNPMGRG